MDFNISRLFITPQRYRYSGISYGLYFSYMKKNHNSVEISKFSEKFIKEDSDIFYRDDFYVILDWNVVYLLKNNAEPLQQNIDKFFNDINSILQFTYPIRYDNYPIYLTNYAPLVLISHCREM